MKWNKITNHWIAEGKWGRWTIKRIRRGIVRTMLNGSFLMLPDEGFTKTVGEAKKLVKKYET